MARFEQMDANKDGFIDKDEFKGAPERFAKLDADNDGKVSKDEFKAARKGRGCAGRCPCGSPKDKENDKSGDKTKVEVE